MSEPEQILGRGRAVLDSFMREHGFAFVAGESGSGSGGPFTRGSYVRGRRRLDVSVRQSLGLVTYRAGEVSLGHEDYVFAVSGGRGAYPGFSDDPVESFRHLQRDLERHGDVFLKGSEEEFAALAERAEVRPTGFKALSREE